LWAEAGAGGWTVLASPRDAGAYALASALGATLVNDGPTGARTAVHQAHKVWLRADPTLVDSAWAGYLGQVNAGTLWIGADAPGLARFGLQTPVAIDVDALAQRLTRWTQRPSSELEEEAAPCLAQGSPGTEVHAVENAASVGRGKARRGRRVGPKN
jgi:hypothetical protein